MRKILSIIVPRWRKNEDGVTAVEFALVGLPFLFMIIGIIEMALMFTAQSLLEASTSQAAREIRTGAVQQGGGEDAFTDAMCGFARVFIPCDKIQYQVVSMESFNDAEEFPPPSYDEDGNLEDQGFDPGGVSDVVMIRTSYTYPIKTPLMQVVLTNNNGTSRVMTSTIVLRTEPYQFEE